MNQIDQAEKPVLAYLRPSLNRIPKSFHEFLVHNLEVVLHHYFRVVLLEDELNDRNIGLVKSADMLLIQTFPEIGLNNFPVTGLKDISIPKIGFLTLDSISPARYDGLAYFEELELDAVFSPDVSLGLRYPAFRNKIFYLPWFITSDNTLPAPEVRTKRFLLVGHNKGTYPWRNRIFPLLKEKLHAEQLPYFQAVGKDFIRALSEAKYIPTDGGFGRIMVNKHLEVPAANSCLITQGTEVVYEMGFRDKVNCLIAEDFLELETKVNWCEADDIRYREIIENGRRLVLERHTEASRSQLLEFYRLSKVRTQGQKIVQPALFGSLELAETNSAKRNFRMTFTDDSVITKAIDELMENGRLEDAKTKFEQLIRNFSGYSPDFLIRAILIHLRQQNYPRAAQNLWVLFNKELIDGRGKKPEPNEWALFLLMLILSGRKKGLKEIYNYYSYEGEAFSDFVQVLAGFTLNNSAHCDYFINRLLTQKYSTASAHTIFPQEADAVIPWFERHFGDFALACYPEIRKKLLSREIIPAQKTENAMLLSPKTQALKIINIQYIAYTVFEARGMRGFLKTRLRKVKNLLYYYFSLNM